MKRILLSTVYQPFCTDDPFDSPDNLVQHGTCHRQFTREQGIFTIHQQSTHLALHLIAANLAAETTVLEYPTLEAFGRLLASAAAEGRPYDLVGITCVSSSVRKARRMCELTSRLSPGSETVVGGGGTLAMGEVIAPFGDHVCRGDGIRFLRELLGQDPDAPLVHPTVPSNHFPNTIMGCEANPRSYSMAVSLGCPRACDFCATSAQFGGRRLPVLGSGAQIMDAMRRVERDLETSFLARAGIRRSVPSICFIIFDENFLCDEELVEAFWRLNRRQICRGTLFLPLLFADARSVSRVGVERLLEMGVDALWIGLESGERRLDKNEGVDFRGLVQELQANGIKVFLSFIVGRANQTAESMDRDRAYALSLGATGYQCAMACPLPGTPYYRRLKRAGRLTLERPEQLNMSHYYIRHDQLDAQQVKQRTIAFQRADYERHGPLALRYMKLRLAGYLRHRASTNPALRARARGFRNDLMDAAGVLSAGTVFGPTEAVRASFRQLRRGLRREVKLLPAAVDVLRGRASATSLLQSVLFTNRVTEPVARRALVARALRWDPRSRERCRTLTGLLRHGRACIEEVRHGVMPWDQPVPVLRRYPARGRPPLFESLDHLAGLSPVAPHEAEDDLDSRPRPNVAAEGAG